MKRGIVPAIVMLVACAALLFLQHPDSRAHGDRPATVIPIISATTATSIPSSTVEPTPAPASLLAKARTATRRQGSVSEHGNFQSSDDSVFDGFNFSARLSWQQDVFFDHHAFVQPVFLGNDRGYASVVKRISSGIWFAQRMNGQWTCARRKSRTNRAFWRPPIFHLTSPKILGSDNVGESTTWKISGTEVDAHDGLLSRFRVTLFIDRRDDLIRQAVESGVVQGSGGRSATVTGSVTYFNYGIPPAPTLPADCFS